MRAMHRVLALAVLALGSAYPMLTGLAGCSLVRQVPVAAVPDAPLPELRESGLTAIWQRHVRLEPGERIRRGWRVGRSIYIATTESRLARIDARSGVLMWSAGLGRENFEIYKPIELPTEDGSPSVYVLVITRGEAFVLSMETGDEFRRARLNVSVSADPVVLGNTIGVGGAGRFYGLYLDRLGAKRWVVPALGDLFDSAPVAVDNNILLASRAGRLWRISADSGDWDWKDRKTNGQIVAGLTADFNAIYVPSLDQRVYAFAADTGAELWQQQLAGRLEQAPVLGSGVVMVMSRERGLFALDRLDGHVLWEVPGVTQIATVLDNSAWIGTSDGNIQRISLRDGSIIAQAPAQGVQLFLRNPVDDNVILVTQSGEVGLYRSR